MKIQNINLILIIIILILLLLLIGKIEEQASLHKKQFCFELKMEKGNWKERQFHGCY